MLETLGHDKDSILVGELDAQSSVVSTELKSGKGSPQLNQKSKSKYTLMSVALDDGEKTHTPRDPKGAIAFVGVSVGSPDFEEEEFWELCRSIVDAGYEEIVFVVGGVLQRHNVFFAHAHKKAIRGKEVTESQMNEYARVKEQKKYGKALSAEKGWIERHKKYTDKLEKEYGKKVTLIPWAEILDGQHGDFNKHLGFINHEFANGKNGIKTYVGKAANGMYEIRAKQTGNMSTHQKELYDSTCVELEPFFKSKNAEYFKEETAAFRMLKVEKYSGRKLHYIYPHKAHEIGAFFLKAIRRALELASDAEKKLMEFYTPQARNKAKKDDTNHRLYQEMEKLKKTNEILLSELNEMRQQLVSKQSEISPKAEKISRLEHQVFAKQKRLEKVGTLVSQLTVVLAELPDLEAEMKEKMARSYTAKLAQLAAEEEQEQQEYESSEEEYNQKAASVPTSPSGEHLSRGSRSSDSGSGPNSSNGTPRANISNGTSPTEEKSRVAKPLGKSPSSGTTPGAPSVVAPQSAMFKQAQAASQPSRAAVPKKSSGNGTRLQKNAAGGGE